MPTKSQGYAQLREDQTWFFLGALQHGAAVENIVWGEATFSDDRKMIEFVPLRNMQTKTGVVREYVGLDNESRKEMALTGELGRVEGISEDAGLDMPAKGGVSMVRADPDAISALRAEMHAQAQAAFASQNAKIDDLIQMVRGMASQGSVSATEPAAVSSGDVSSGAASSMSDAMSVIAGGDKRKTATPPARANAG